MAQQGVHSVSVIKHFCIERSILGGGGGATRLEDTTGFGPHNSAKRANVSHSSGLTGLLEAGLTAPVSHDRKE